ncbi:trafficking protein particle complex subunit 13-like isoform X2 [Homarus americanus]|uniref:trafficking protein particle complex subunit 13-like isoform X2 n=1 Tax=Homarus americanus TaxID=6706 RepID=UPI001C44136E|nr:trafficking protein particle complex subunit 13-like isoform X2 [Homarus americanus]
MESKDKDHILSLKVMRLTRPSLFTGLAIGCDARDLPGEYLNADIRADIAIPQGLSNTGVGHMLLLPQSFGNIYLGETFSCCLCVHNDGSDSIREVSIKAVLQMSNQRVPLLGEDDNEMLHQLEGNGTINEVIQHEVKDIGTHILVCAVSYLSSSGDRLSFRKFFKFQVMKPLDVKTKFYNAEDYVSDEVYLEAGVQNITSGPLCLEKVELEPSPYFSVTPMNKVSQESNTLVFGRMNVVNPHDTRQYLYCLKPKPEARSNPAALRQATAIGKLDIVWRTNMGDRGRLQTSQLQRMAPQYGDVRVTVERIPSVVRLEEQFEVGLSITNICERTLELHLDFLGGGGGSEWSGVSSRSLPSLQPGQSTNLSLSLVPLQTGLQTIAGVRLTDTFLKRTYNYENLAQVFITNEKSVEHESFFSAWVNQVA